MNKEEKDLHIHSLILERKVAFANLVRAYLKFNIPSAKKIEVDEDGDIIINDNKFKFDVSDYTGAIDKYIFFNPNNGRIVIQNGDVKKVYRVDVQLHDE